MTVLSRDVNLASRFEQARHDKLGAIRVSRALKELAESSSRNRDWSLGNLVNVKVKHGAEIEIYSPDRGGKS